MTKRVLTFLVSIITFTSLFGYGIGQFTIITNDDQILKVYNLDINGDYVYYTKTEEDSNDVMRIPTSNVLIIKDNHGNMIEPTCNDFLSKDILATKSKTLSGHVSRPEIIWQQTGNVFTNKDGTQLFEAFSSEETGNTLWFQKREEKPNEIMLTRAPKKMGKHPSDNYIVPDFVIIDGQSFKVTRIESETFYSSMWGNPYKTTIRELSLPVTLEEIGDKAFSKSFKGTKLVLPDSLKWIGEKAFLSSGNMSFIELYIPKTIEFIGKDAFLFLGDSPNCSYRGFFQGNITSLPDFITSDNCHQYGIDENAIENYERKNGMRK